MNDFFFDMRLESVKIFIVDYLVGQKFNSRLIVDYIYIKFFKQLL